jgi:hypothetical protein
MVLCEYQQKAEFDKLKIRAAFFGVNLDEKVKEKKEVVKKNSQEEFFTFQDPKEYENMNPEERKKLTDKMVSKHQEWASGKLKKG